MTTPLSSLLCWYTFSARNELSNALNIKSSNKEFSTTQINYKMHFFHPAFEYYLQKLCWKPKPLASLWPYPKSSSVLMCRINFWLYGYPCFSCTAFEHYFCLHLLGWMWIMIKVSKEIYVDASELNDILQSSLGLWN